MYLVFWHFKYYSMNIFAHIWLRRSTVVMAGREGKVTSIHHNGAAEFSFSRSTASTVRIGMAPRRTSSCGVGRSAAAVGRLLCARRTAGTLHPSLSSVQPTVSQTAGRLMSCLRQPALDGRRGKRSLCCCAKMQKLPGWRV